MPEETPDTHTETEGDVATFIAKYGKPYDPAADDYRRPLFAAPTKAGKNTAIYNAHSYHTKVPPQGIIPYIQHYTDPGELVLDPFCGSGMTGVAALMTGRFAILNDLSPAAVHIARNYCSPANVTALRATFDRIKDAVRDEFTWLYGTKCERCGGQAVIQYTIWSDVFECGRCGTELVLWDLAVDRQSGAVRGDLICPRCDAEWRKPQLRWLKAVPVVTNYNCPHCKPQRSEHPVTDAERQRIAEIESTAIPYWYPTTPFLEQDWEMWRAEHGEMGITDVSKFFTKRNLWALARLWHEIHRLSDDSRVDHLAFAFTSSVPNASRLYKYRSDRKGGILTGTLYIAALNCELSVEALFERKLHDIDWRISGEAAFLTQSAADLHSIVDNSVDFVFTDPPFGSNIFYADCNMIWEAWLNQGFTDQSQEAVVHIKHKSRNTLPDYARLMTDSFREMYRVLKPGRWASVVFHNSDNRIWQTILDAAESAGFELAEINAFDKEQLSFKGIRGQKGLERVTNQDIVLNLHKPGPNHVRAPNGTARTKDREARVVQRIAEFLETRPPVEQRTLQHLWNQVLYDLIASGSVQVSMADVDAMLPHYFKQVDGHWYLRGESVVGGRVFEIRNETDALTWLNAVLSEEPQTTGDLIPQWQQVTFQAADAITRTLDELLAENFWQDSRSGKWRVPNAPERERMSAQQEIADRARMRQIRRYLDGEIDSQPNHAELCGWVQFAYEHKIFEEAVRLFANIHAPEVDDELYRQTRKVAQFCRMQLGKSRDDKQLPLL